MKGKDWNDYFKSLPQSKRNSLLRALETLAKDEMFNKTFGNSFLELASILKHPLS